jgi:hypothetical protein
MCLHQIIADSAPTLPSLHAMIWNRPNTCVHLSNTSSPIGDGAHIKYIGGLSVHQMARI